MGHNNNTLLRTDAGLLFCFSWLSLKKGRKRSNDNIFKILFDGEVKLQRSNHHNRKCLSLHDSVFQKQKSSAESCSRWAVSEMKERFQQIVAHKLSLK